MKTIAAKQPEAPSSGSAHRVSKKPAFSSHMDYMFPSSNIAALLRNQKVQRAVKVGNPNDKYEREADHVADKVIKGESSGLISRMENNGSASPSISQDHKTGHHVQRQAGEEEEEAQTKRLQRQPVEEEEEMMQPKLIQRQGPEEEEEEAQPKLLQRQQEEEEEMMQPKLVQRQGQEEEEEEELQSLQADGKSGSSGNSTLAAKAIDTAGSGNPMNPSTRSTLESGMGTDFGNVKVHEDETARQAARSLDARAFTHKNDIWLGQGESQNDVRLMAHEATHVVQQTGTIQRLQRNDTPPPSPTAVPATTPEIPVEAQIDPAELPLETGRVDTANNKITFSEILIPPFKMQAHRGAAYRSHTLKRQRNYTRGNPNQRDKWRREVSTARIRSVLENKTKRSQNITEIDPGGTYVFEVPVRGNAPTPFIFGSLDDVAVQMTTPMWARQSRNPPLNFYDVDHIVELQLANWSNDSWANNLDNMELLDSAINQDSGRKLKANIISKVNAFLGVTGDRFGTSVADIKQRYDLEFQTPVPGGGGAGNVGRNNYWTREDIEQARHMNSVHSRGLEVLGEEGTARVFSTATGGLGKAFSINGPLIYNEYTWLKPFTIAEKNFNTEGDNIEETSEFGHFMVHVPRDDPDWQGAPFERVTIDRVPGAQYAGRINKASVQAQFRNLRKKGASPIRMDTFDIRPDTGVTATGAILPDISFLRGGLNFTFDNGSLRVYKEFTNGEIEVPNPFSIRSSSLIVFYDTGEGFGGSGRVDFGIDNVGEGFVEVSVSTGGGLGLGGGFDFDSNLFDPARIEISYIDGVFRGRGEIGIPRGRVTGINAATFTAAIEGNSISASGRVSPTLEAIEEGIVNLSYSPEEGVSIGGGLQLSNSIPNIDSGQIDVEISKPPDAENWDLSATGELQASLAGITATVNVNYNNGLFTIEGNGEYNRGMMSGTLQVGATNRRVDDEGNITDEQGSQIIAYGGGNVSVRITPWLEGTAGIKILPNGEIELSGEIALPDSLDIFPEQRMDRNLFSINLDIPILGFAVAGQRIGVFATIGGGLDLSAGVGPGQLTELGLGITYNPDHEDQTRITGGARLVIPADAGLRLFIRGSLGVGIPIVSASLGLEIGGELGLEGAVEAGVQVEWSPSQGLSLDAEGEIWVQPKFRFDITGFLEVEADLFVTSIDLYSKRWELAAFEFGPDLRFGLRLPIHYQEGEAFDISWDDVEFEVPDIDTDEIISGLIDRVV